MWLLRPPGVYAPQGDTDLLLGALRRTGVPRGSRMLDICTGTGLVALVGARMGATDVHAVDLSARAALAARWNARLRRLPVTVHRGDFLDRPTGRFDVITANPPYVPCPDRDHGLPMAARGARAWNAGEDGRECLDRLCAAAPRLLAPGGVMLIVHSALSGPYRTLGQLREGGLKAAVVRRSRKPFGPVLRGRAAWLEERGLIEPGQREEELVVVRADLAPRGG
ncbi:HemK2/MTQ2 family protein methyltransferase [Streptomyces ovatisporus]|uniref:HemK2/MTQ2 family protein methyltransferase n=1 Tax=Streptomyces ovatisporus TaxID=1128682 RepID=A0ABV9AB69_9ACTN